MVLAIPIDRERLYRHVVAACHSVGVRYEVFDIYASNWMSALARMRPSGCIYVPEFRYASWRELFGERIRFINQQLGIPVYPRLHELELYESKRRMAYWLEHQALPHPRTWIFGNREEALDFIQTASFPLVFKTDFGNAGSGVRVLKDKRAALAILARSFGNGYRVPTFREGNPDLIARAKALARPLFRKLRGMRDLPRDVELDVMLFQEAVPIRHEWRLVKSGDSYFGSEKLLGLRGLHSGSGHSAWTIPPIRAFDLAREICRKGDFATMAIDMFETERGSLLVNELQAVFGVVAKNQMYKQEDGRLKGCRLVWDEEAQTWREEEGEFGQDYCYRLRVEDFMRQIHFLEPGCSTIRRCADGSQSARIF